MTASTKTKKPAVGGKNGKKEKVFHPSSRKAGQLARKSLRTDKLKSLRSQRKEKHGIDADVYGFFYHMMPEEGVLTLAELHELVRDNWLTRHDDELAAEKAARRPGRPKSKREVELEDEKQLEADEYRTGFEVIDLTHKANVDLFRAWNQKEVAYIGLLRFIRIFSGEPERTVISRPGKHVSIIGNGQDQAMDVEQS
ncbi:hypothetical protein D9611_006409 [Ephemerocybe angulata]|uniref:Uncharacterized protein n=2 Tax=Ephemerocybe angulata TaxID=980116 RepID=A0A8H6MAW9_9AGAR|nr:hypothetical protein D9611_006409 [Tulosesus angulatus]KAF6761600.1 hypothetical protein DFP72DRAFT_842489 [Tulosesus angulatus]